ncbi:MAG: serine/threonine-protein kinase [Candidatus Margulisbacteria bacterium]|nr:serine/threonine-protein kinase [Candidatus Margulisiibacteriota bacterium]
MSTLGISATAININSASKTRRTPVVGYTPLKISAGQSIGRFVIDKKIGQGGFGEVWRAKDQLGRFFALKFDHLQAECDFDQEAAAFEQIQANGGHATIISFLGKEKDGDLSYRIFEYVQRENLLSHLGGVVEAEGRGLSFTQSLTYLRQIAGGVQFLHGIGLLHNDLKPDNILIVDDRELKIIDFGAATPYPAGLYGGTPMFSSPEKLFMHQIDRRSDIFSLGIIFYYMLTREHPFASQTIADTKAVANIQSGKISLGLYSLPKEIRSLVSRLLAHRPEDRFQTCDEMIRAIDHAIETAPKAETIWQAWMRKATRLAERLLYRFADLKQKYLHRKIG